MCTTLPTPWRQELCFLSSSESPSQCSPTGPVLVKPLKLYMPPSLMKPNKSFLFTFSKPSALACRPPDTKSYLITTRCGAPPMCQNVPNPFSHWIPEITWCGPLICYPHFTGKEPEAQVAKVRFGSGSVSFQNSCSLSYTILILCSKSLHWFSV